MKKSRFTLYRVVVIGLMAAMVFVCTMFLGIRIPTPTGTTQLKTANAICLLTGLLFGGWTGGLAAGIGLLQGRQRPHQHRYAVQKFHQLIHAAHAGGAAGKNKGRNWLAAICGAGAYWLLYIGKSITVLCLGGSAFSAAFIATAPKMLTGGINAVFAVVVSNLLVGLLRPKLEAAGVFEALKKH